MNKVWFVWLNNGLGWEDSADYLIDVRTDGDDVANKIGELALEKFFKENGVGDYERRSPRIDSYSSATYWVDEVDVNKVHL